MLKTVESYLRQGGAEGWSPVTVREYRKRLVPFVAFLHKKGRRRFADVTPEDIDAFVLHLVESGVRKSTRMGWASTIRAFFRRLVEDGSILANPARDIAMPDDGEPDLPPAPLEEHEVTELLESLPRRNVVDLRNRLHLELLYGCGLRITESTALDVRDVDLTERTVLVRGGKGDKDRLLPMMSGVLGALQDYLALRRSLLKGPDHGALLLSRRGQRLNPASFRMWLASFNKQRKGKKPVHPHLLRHSIAVHLLRGGADIRHIQEFLGHASLETTKIYLRLVPGSLRQDYDDAMPDIAVELPA